MLDILSYLPCGEKAVFRKGQVICHAKDPGGLLYLMISGMVTTRIMDPDTLRKTVVEFHGPDSFFGEESLIGGDYVYTAVAMLDTEVMAWDAAALKMLIAEKKPLLGMALAQYFAARVLALGDRVRIASTETIEVRLGKLLRQLAKTFGEEAKGKSTILPAVTHGILAEYVGTSREIVTHYMNVMRNRGEIEYSRTGILMHTVPVKPRKKAA